MVRKRCRNHPDRFTVSKELCAPCYERTPERRLKKRKHDEKNKDKRKISRLIRESKNPGLVRDRQLRRSVGIGLGDYYHILKVQGGVCAICSKEEQRMVSGKRVMLAVDHDHKTGKVRKLLCSLCNLGLGYFKDDPKILRIAADYVEEF